MRVVWRKFGENWLDPSHLSQSGELLQRMQRISAVLAKLFLRAYLEESLVKTG
jgi:hypothetical protein